jgi:radical SAM superfamily enzyme
LPKETEKEVLETIYFLNKIKIWGVKIHLLYILKNTKLYNYYEKFPWKIMTKEEYIKIVCRVIKVLDKNIVE